MRTPTDSTVRPCARYRSLGIAALLVALTSACSVSDPSVLEPDEDGAGGSTPPAEVPGQTPGQTPSVPPTGQPDPEPEPDPAPSNEPTRPPVQAPGAEAVFTPLPSDLGTVDNLFDRDGYENLDVIRIDLRTVTTPGTCVLGDESGCTLADVIGDTDNTDELKVDIPVHFSATDFADDGSVANAELRQRGGTTRQAPQKSFRVELDDKDALWRGERRLLLNKHPYENSRVRNKLSMQLMSEVPHLYSFRTQFANLFIDDGQGAVDYGLFTHVEDPGGRWLKRRGLNEDDRLYKTEFFRFSEREFEAIRVDENGAPINEAQFESLLEIENGDDHRALFKVMTALHDPERSFQSVLDEHFNRNNLATWLAVNILLHQTDAVTHNYILHNPAGTERFYFVPWDYDGTLFLEQEPPTDGYSNQALGKRLFYGYARNINNVVITEFLKLPGAHQLMLDAARFIQANYLTTERVDTLEMALRDLTAPYISRSPDVDNLINGFNPASGPRFGAFIAGNLDALATRYSVPMPPTLLTPRQEGAQWVFEWERAFEVTGNGLSYELQISRSLNFAAGDIVLQRNGIADVGDTIVQRVDAAQLSPGVHFVRVIARADNEPQRFWQVATNVVRQDGQEWYGMERFDVQ